MPSYLKDELDISSSLSGILSTLPFVGLLVCTQAIGKFFLYCQQERNWSTRSRVHSSVCSASFVWISASDLQTLCKSQIHSIHSPLPPHCSFSHIFFLLRCIYSITTSIHRSVRQWSMFIAFLGPSFFLLLLGFSGAVSVLPLAVLLLVLGQSLLGAAQCGIG